MNGIELLRWVTSVAVPALAGLAGVSLGAWLTGRREMRQRRHQFISDQLRHFYSPLLGIRSEIKMRSDLRLRISHAADSEWRALCEFMEPAGPEALRDLTERRSTEFERIIEYDNQQLAEKLIPAYKQMVVIFRENMWLAETETRAHFGKLIEFVEIWERWLARSLPAEVLQRLQHSEEQLHPLYAHLQQKHDELRNRLATGED